MVHGATSHQGAIHNESMSDYAKQFKQNSAHLKQLIGTRWTDQQWTETTEEYLTLAPGDDLLDRQEALKASMFV
jgi:hypothetical protein